MELNIIKLFQRGVTKFKERWNCCKCEEKICKDDLYVRLCLDCIEEIMNDKEEREVGEST